MDYIPTYIAQARREPVTYAHPTLEPVLKQTYGVDGRYQEDVMAVTQALAGFTLAEATLCTRSARSSATSRRAEVKFVSVRFGTAVHARTVIEAVWKDF